MDLYAYSMIYKIDTERLLKDLNINIKRLRGVRFMQFEKPMDEKQVFDGEVAKLFNSFVGKPVLYIHARQGGANREWCKMDELAKHPRYLCDVDDSFDNTYCDIYFDIKDINIEDYVNRFTIEGREKLKNE